MEDNRYKIYPSKETKGFYVVEDADTGLVCVFEEHRFNETQKMMFKDETPMLSAGVMAIAKATREMGDWLRNNHYEKIF